MATKSASETTSHASLRSVAHERFMDRLYDGSLRPAALVSQRELCELLDVRMGPMREALKRLEAEGVVTLIPQRGIRILDIDEKTINDAFEMRLLIECAAVRAFAERGNLDLGRDLLARTRAAIDDPTDPRPGDALEEINRLTTLDHEMHRTFVSALDNSFADEVFDRLLGRLRLSRLVFRLRKFSDGRAFVEHVEILEKVLVGDGVGAAEAMERHLNTSWRRALGLAEQ